MQRDVLMMPLFLGQTAPAASDAAGQPLEQVAALSLWELVLAGGWVMIPIAACSILVVGLVVYCLMTLRPSSITREELDSGIDSALEREDLGELVKFLEGRPEAVAGVLRSVLAFMDRRKGADTEAMQAVAEGEGNRWATAMNQRVVYLLDIGALAPMLGLFGTVVGILHSFGSIAAEPSPMRTMMLAGGVSQALVATAGGLIVGITAMFFYSYFRGRVQHLISLFEIESTARVQELIALRRRLQS